MTIKMSVLAACVASALLASPALAASAEATTTTLASMKGQFVDLPGVHLWYLDSGGDGTPVVMLHANTGTSESWRHQFEPLIKAGYRVIAFDRRGRGKSTPADTGPQPGSVSEDIEALAAQLKLKPFHLVGVAGGGFVALDYASWHPERLRSLIVGASTGAVRDAPVQDAIKRIEIPEIRKQNASYREVGPSYRAVNPQGVEEWLAIEHQSESQHGVKSQPMRTPNTFAKLETIKTPTLIVAAGADLLAPPSLMKLWVGHVANHEWAMVPESGHSIAWEKPDEFNALLVKFMAKH